MNVIEIKMEIKKFKNHPNLRGKRRDELLEILRKLYKKNGKDFSQLKTEKPEKAPKIYYGIDAVPEGHRRASMEEAAKAKKVYYYGIKEIDSKVLSHYGLLQKKEKEEEEDKNSQLRVKMIGLRGKFFRLKKLHDASKNEKEKKKLMIELKQIKDEVEALNKLMKKDNVLSLSDMRVKMAGLRGKYTKLGKDYDNADTTKEKKKIFSELKKLETEMLELNEQIETQKNNEKKKK
jgi:hypothetical protein